MKEQERIFELEKKVEKLTLELEKVVRKLELQEQINDIIMPIKPARIQKLILDNGFN